MIRPAKFPPDHDQLLSRRDPASLVPPEQNLSAQASRIQNLAVEWSNKSTLPLHHAVLDILFEIAEQELRAALILSHIGGCVGRPCSTSWEIRQRLEQTLRDRAEHNLIS